MAIPSKKFIPYYRVSTVKQGQSGLGLEAQRAAVHSFAAGQGQLGQEFVEVESGKKNQRPQLAAAMAEASRVGGPCSLPSWTGSPETRALSSPCATRG